MLGSSLVLSPSSKPGLSQRISLPAKGRAGNGWGGKSDKDSSILAKYTARNTDYNGFKNIVKHSSLPQLSSLAGKLHGKKPDTNVSKLPSKILGGKKMSDASM